MSNINQNQMNNKGRTGRFTSRIILFFFIAICIIACKKDASTKAIVSVINQNNAPVSEAYITLWQDTAVNPVNGVQSTLRVTKKSDAAGKAEFEFKLEAFLNIEVIKGPDTARSFIRLKENETVTQTVNL